MTKIQFIVLFWGKCTVVIVIDFCLTLCFQGCGLKKLFYLVEGSPKDLKGNPGPEVEIFLKVQYVMDFNFSPVDELMSLRLVRIEPA